MKIELNYKNKEMINIFFGNIIKTTNKDNKEINNYYLFEKINQINIDDEIFLTFLKEDIK